jgi:hypothetical protein
VVPVKKVMSDKSPAQRVRTGIKSLTAEVAKAAKEDNSFTAEVAKDAKELKSLTAKDAKE